MQFVTNKNLSVVGDFYVEFIKINGTYQNDRNPGNLGLSLQTKASIWIERSCLLLQNYSIWTHLHSGRVFFCQLR